MAQAQEIAQLYYTLDAKAGPGAETVLDDQIIGLEELAQVAEETGIPIGELRSLVNDLVEELDPAGIAAEAMAEALKDMNEATEESIDSLSAQIRLFSEGAQIEGTRADAMRKLIELETQIKARLTSGNVTLEQRIRLEQELARTQGAINAGIAAGMARAGGAVSSSTRNVREGTAAVKAFGDRWGMATLQIVDAAGNVAQAGALSGRSLKGLLLGATSLVGVIGTGGALVTAAGIGAQAIITLFTRAREEAKKLADEFKKEIKEMQDAGDFVGLKDKLAKIYQGTSSGDFKDGLGFIETEISRLESKLARTELFAGGFGIQKQIDELKKKRKPLQEQFETIRKIIIDGRVQVERAAAIPIKTEAKSNEAIAREAKQAADAQKQLAGSFRDVVQGFRDLALSVGGTGGNAALVAYDKQVRELHDRFTALKDPTEAQRREFEELNKSAAKVRDTLKRIEASKAAKVFRELQASMTVTAVDDLQNGLEDLLGTINTLRTQGPIDEAAARQMVQLQMELIRAKQEEEQLDDRIRVILRDKISAMDAQLALGELLLAKQDELKKTTITDEASRRRTLALEAQIAKLKEQIAALGGKVTNETDKGATHLQKWAGYLEASASAAFGVASALLGADHSITKMLGGTLQMVSGFSQIADLAQKAGSLSTLFSTGAGIASALPGIGAIIGGGLSLLSVLGGKKDEPSPEELERNRILKANNERLAELRLTLDKTIQLSVGGGLAASVRDVELTEQRQIDIYGGTGTFHRAIEEVLADLRKLGVGLEDIKALAADAGIELSTIPTIEQLLQLQEFLRTQTLATLFAGLTGELKKLELAAQLDPDAFAGLEGVFARLRILTGPSGIPAITEALAGLDPNSATYIEDVIAALTELGLSADSLDLSALAGLTPDEFLAEIVKIVTGLRANIPKVKSAADLFAEAIDLLGAAFEFGAVDVQQRLAGTFDALKKLFPELAAQIDFTSDESFRASLANIIKNFSADGVLTEAEEAQIAVLRQLLAAYNASRDAAQQAADAAQREADEAKRAAEEKKRAEEQAAAELARAEEEHRRRIIRLADAYIQVNNIEDPTEILKIRVKALSESFPKLASYLDDFDLSTKEGADGLERWIEEMLKSPASLQALADATGMTIDDLIAYLLDLEGAADAAGTHIASLAEQLSTAFAEVDFGLALENITDPIEKLMRTARAAAAADAKIRAALGAADLSTAGGRAAAEASLISLGKGTTDQATREAILRILEAIRAVPLDAGLGEPGAGLGAGSPPTKDGSDTSRSVFLVEDVRFAQLLDYTSRTAIAVEGMWALLQTRVAPISAPVLPPQAATAAAIFGGASYTAQAQTPGGMTVSVTLLFQGTVYLGSREEASEIITPAVAEGVLQAAGRQFTVQRQLKGRGVR